jgi:hypothetical protein
MKKFQRKIENFTCQNCKTKVKGTGFTNHCPNCLYSKHVDINPGDRQSACGGIMKPAWIDVKAGQYIIRHKCLKCGIEKNNKISGQDNMESVIRLAKTLAEK